MAVGDVVGKVNWGNFTFQPASGVQICITQFFSGSHSASYGNVQSRGTDMSSNACYWHSHYSQNGTTALWGAASHSHKWFIDNTHYVYIYTSTTSYWGGFSGIQTQ